MDLEWVGEHDQDDNSELSNGGGNIWLILLHDVTEDGVSEGKVPGDGDDDVDCAGGADGGEDHGGDNLWAVVFDFVDDGEHVLVAGVGEDDDGQGTQGRKCALGLDAANWAAVLLGVAGGVVVDDQHNQVSNGNQSNDGGVLQGVETSQEGQWNDDQPRGMLVTFLASVP